MKPMLARTYGPKYTRFPSYLQPKLNGVRALFQFSPQPPSSEIPVFQSRDEKLWKREVLTHLSDELRSIRDQLHGAILDGEFYVHGWRLQRINGAIAVNRKEPSVDTPHICFHVFDVVDPSKSFSSRFFDVMNLLLDAKLPHIIPVRAAFIGDVVELEQHFHFWTKEGYEGVMLRPDGPYEFGETPHGTQKRSEFLWKYKSWEDGEFLCVGVTSGEGKADIGIGALELIIDNLMGALFIDSKLTGKTFKVGTGFTDEERIEYAANPPIGKLIKVRYLELTADGIPFNPSFLCVMQ